MQRSSIYEFFQPPRCRANREQLYEHFKNVRWQLERLRIADKFGVFPFWCGVSYAVV